MQDSRTTNSQSLLTGKATIKTFSLFWLFQTAEHKAKGYKDHINANYKLFNFIKPFIKLIKAKPFKIKFTSKPTIIYADLASNPIFLINSRVTDWKSPSLYNSRTLSRNNPLSRHGKAHSRISKNCLTDDNLHSIAFASLFFIIPTQFLWINPVYLRTLIYSGQSFEELQKVLKTSSKIKTKDQWNLQMRADCEVWIGCINRADCCRYSH